MSAEGKVERLRKELAEAMEEAGIKQHAKTCPDCGERNPADVHTCSPKQSAPSAEPVAWMIHWPDEPELGHYFAEEPNEFAISVPLYTAPQPDSGLYADPVEVAAKREERIAARARAYVDKDARVAELEAEVERLRKDAERLDYLDERNRQKNERNGTRYGWRLSENHNRIALEDNHHPAICVREAIDAALAAKGE